MLKSSCLLIVFHFIFSVTVKGQDTGADLPPNLRIAREQVYLHLDNSLYSAGDTVHFNGYVGLGGLPATGATNLYVDWFEEQGDLLCHQVYPLLNGMAAGQWVVPAYTAADGFKVVAYTSGLLHADSSRVFHQDIHLLGIETPRPFFLNLYPEGGTLAAGIFNRVGYHLTGNAAAEMQLISSTGDTLATIATKGQEYGSFRFVPEKGKAYSIHLPVSGMDDIALPPVQEQGVALEVTPYTTFINVMLHKSPGMPATGWKLSGIMQGEVAYQSVFSLKSRDSGYVNIPVENLPEGELLLILSNSRHQVLASRSVYIPAAQLPAGASFQVIDKNSSEKAAKEWQLIYADSVPAMLSVAVKDASLPRQKASPQGWLLLGREVPDSLFEKKDIITQRTIDDILRCSAPVKAYQEKTPDRYGRDLSWFCLSGRVRGKKLPAVVNLVVRSNNRYQPLKLPLDQEGRFRDSSFVLFDSCYVALAAGQEKLTLEIDTLPPAAFARYPFTGKGTAKNINKEKKEKDEKKKTVTANLPPQLAAYVDTTGKYRALPTVTVASAKKWRTKMDSVEHFYMSERMLTSYPNGYPVNFDNDPSVYMGGATLWDLLQGRIPGYGYTKAGKSPPAAQVFVDEMEISPEGVVDLQLPTIAFVKYIPRRGVSLLGGKWGAVLLIYTKKYTDPTLKERLTHNWGKALTGYTSYIPFGQAAGFNTRGKDDTDLRKTLYWEPGVVMDKDAPSLDINFKNNDIAQQWRVIVAGMRVDGMPVYYEKIVNR
ncbi:MAG: hypothetical protein QM640_03165 [Niabella sp.]